MAKIITFNGRQYVEPGSYAMTKSGNPAQLAAGSVGNVAIIDTGLGTGYGYGSGITGQNESGEIYAFNDPKSAKRALRGGVIWDLIDALFTPNGSGSNGVQTLFYTRAASTTGANIQILLAGTDVKTTVVAKNEGLGGNGKKLSTVLTKGYGVRAVAGAVDNTAVVFEFYEGQYRGQDENGIEYDVAESKVVNNLICRSKELKTVGDWYKWASKDSQFNQYFRFTEAATPDLTTALVASITTTLSDITILTGGTETYDSTSVDEVLSNIEDLDNSSFLLLDYGATPGSVTTNQGIVSANNSKILAYILTTSTFTDKIAYGGGGQDKSEFQSVSLSSAAQYDSPYMVIAHGGVKVDNVSNVGTTSLMVKNSLYHAALICGLNAGLPSQVPCTYKAINIKGLVHKMSKTEREQAIQGGVTSTRQVTGMGWVVNQGVNTLQINDDLIESDGKSPEIQIMRIEHQLNKEICINSTPRFVGGNLNTASPDEIKAYVEGYLLDKTATKTKDNLIISFKNVTAELRDGTSWFVEYCYVPNGPINKLFYTGFILTPTASI